MSYEERLRETGLTTITTYKILRGIDKVDKDWMFQRGDTDTRGHNWKLKTRMNQRDVRKYFFSHRVVRPWNSLESDVVEAGTIHSFKARYDKAHGAGRERT